MLEKCFTGRQHYISYKNKYDLLNKIKYYLENYKKTGIKIAERAHFKLNKEFSSIEFWSKIFDLLKK